MDLVGNGQIDKFDFWDYLDVQPTQYTDKLFELIDSDGSGKIDFSEYCSLLVTYCMFNQEDILRFAFDCFDADGSGEIDNEEFEDLIDMLNKGDPKFTDTIKETEKKIREADIAQLTFWEFRELNRKYPLLLMPAFDIQDKMQEHTLGSNVWVKVQENVSHAEDILRQEEEQFGMPVAETKWETRLQRFGFARTYAPIDLDYINSMRPSRIYLKKEEAKDSDDEEAEEKPESAISEVDRQESQRLALSSREEEVLALGLGDDKEVLALEGEEHLEESVAIVPKKLPKKKKRKKTTKERRAKHGHDMGKIAENSGLLSQPVSRASRTALAPLKTPPHHTPHSSASKSEAPRFPTGDLSQAR
eukprot:CAMPEP_0172628264 /NCGR_PEP_ID=MMETSP1068-20121228/160735_1 /TAXON_ID=35684 /ORGANISM="Pseudopedinella elastica, Strain CCMP716" /LENGTH=359 /DNA_ID=CAMNT_0013438395 /DNA_START=12 /DNA_END=1091 /DNA_ORIENTATION=-